MLGGPPGLWGWMTTHWVRLPRAWSWVLWRAVSKAQWSAAVQWREQFLAFDRPDRVLSRDLVEDFLATVATPHQLMDLVEQLRHEKCLLGRDCRRLEALLLEQTNASGQWKRHRGRQPA